MGDPEITELLEQIKFIRKNDSDMKTNINRTIGEIVSHINEIHIEFFVSIPRGGKTRKMKKRKHKKPSHNKRKKPRKSSKR